MLNVHPAFATWGPIVGADNIGFILPADRGSSNPALECNSIYSFSGRQEGARRVENQRSNVAYTFEGKTIVPDCP